MGRVLFVSQNPLERAENLKAVWDAYDGDKDFRHGQEAMRTAEADGYAAVLCDALPCYIEGKDRCVSVVIDHGLTGGKLYGLYEQRDVDAAAFAQTDYAISTSEAGVPITAGQLGIPTSRVLVLGMPRTDAYFGKSKGDGGTILAEYPRAYLYAPTFRDSEMGGRFPRIDWDEVNSLLGQDEIVMVKRHYFTGEPMVGRRLDHVMEVSPWEPTMPYLIDCDAVLSDYSSIVFDGYLLGKNAVVTLDDMGEYMADRGMYYRFPDQYCSRAVCAEGGSRALVEALRDAAASDIGPVERRCLDLVASACDGHSTERLCALLKEVSS